MPPAPELDPEAIVDMYAKEGVRIRDITKHFKTSFYRVRAILKERGIPLRRGGVLFEKGRTPWNKGKPCYERRGENHPNWKGGISYTDKQFRCHTIEYKNFKRALLERDEVCKWCGTDKRLEVHHIVPWRECKGTDLEYDLSNGIILCFTCHNKTNGKEMELVDFFRKMIE